MDNLPQQRIKNDPLAGHPVDSLIRARGFQLSRGNNIADLPQYLPLSRQQLDDFFTFMHRYSHRLVLHDLFRLQPECKAEDLTHYVSSNSLIRILAQLENFGMISRKSDGRIVIHLPADLTVGWILEWYIATLMENVFASPALFNVGILGTDTGGDYDVLASWLNRLVYFEAKSAPPKGIHNPEIAAFLKRIQQLKPDLAIFFNDTHLRVKDKIVLMFEEELIQLKGIESLKQYPVLRVQEQIFHIQHSIYILNSKRDVRQNLKVVFHDYLQHQGVFNWLF
ncbi:MAG: hypothetical protein GXO78_13300 [Calditrichaeota bacterium]|nr:hypothetical protein [Calditrichota bacterium]